MPSTFIKYTRSEASRSLQSKPIPNHVLNVIAQRVRYTDDPITGLKSGQCYMGDFTTIGISRSAYRSAIRNLQKWGFITTHTTNKGTIVTLISSSIYDLNGEIQPSEQPPNDHQDSHPATIKRPSTRPLNKNGKKDKNERMERSRAFAPPSQIEVHEYMKEKGLSEISESHSFVDFYESKGWMVGKNKMKDWKAAVRNWIKRNGDKNGKQGQTARELLNDYSWADSDQRTIRDDQIILPAISKGPG